MTLRSGEGMGDSTIKGMRVFIVECDFLSVWKILFLSMVTSVSTVRGCCHEVTFFCAIKQWQSFSRVPLPRFSHLMIEFNCGLTDHS